MVKYGFVSITKERTYYGYICDHCGSHLGGIETINKGNYTEEHDDIVGWNFCPYCGEELWDEKRYE